jgi:hypothetical protein
MRKFTPGLVSRFFSRQTVVNDPGEHGGEAASGRCEPDYCAERPPAKGLVKGVYSLFPPQPVFGPLPRPIPRLADDPPISDNEP